MTPELNEASQKIRQEREKAKRIGYLIYVLVLIVGILGWIFWKWYALLIALVLAFILGSIYSVIVGRKMQKKYGLDIFEQEALYKNAPFEDFEVDNND